MPVKRIKVHKRNAVRAKSSMVQNAGILMTIEGEHAPHGPCVVRYQKGGKTFYQVECDCERCIDGTAMLTILVQ